VKVLFSIPMRDVRIIHENVLRQLNALKMSFSALDEGVRRG
jgi:hypothetical protein